MTPIFIFELNGFGNGSNKVAPIDLFGSSWAVDKEFNFRSKLYVLARDTFFEGTTINSKLLLIAELLVIPLKVIVSANPGSISMEPLKSSNQSNCSANW